MAEPFLSMLQWVVGTLATGVGSFLATNIDDLLVLMLLFAQADAQAHRSSLFHSSETSSDRNNQPLRDHQIVLGQYLGFSAIVAISLLGFWGGMVFPQPVMGSLGILPIALGVSSLRPGSTRDCSTDASSPVSPPVLAQSWQSPVLQIAALTIACGGDNVSVYAALFSTLNLGQLTGVLALFWAALGGWCGLARHLSRQRAIAQPLARYGRRLAPWVLISLGVWILIKSETLGFLTQLAVQLWVT